MQRNTISFHLVAGCLVLLLAGSALAEEAVRVLVDTGKSTLTVLRGDTVLATFEDVAIGRYGKTYFKRQGDNKTPLGKFRIGWIKEDSRYYRFLGLDYPDLESANRALVDGRISEPQWQAIRVAVQAGKTPPQNTPLGGFIGIHGVGAGDPEVHAQYNWTNGCVALTNEQLDRLLRWVGVGTQVEIR
ncbi:MAG: L,D-transpeptidase [Gammaproteobacteria bacterium]|jgi:murein L,D-transpeptidase YafK